MARFPLDLAKFKKVHMDEQSATLQHPQGHTIKIALSGLDASTKKHLSSLPLSKQLKKMADGGMVDLDENAEESPNDLDQMNEEALKKENYSEENGLSALGQPEDSNEDDRELSDEDSYDMVDSIRKKMKLKRGF